MSLTERPYQLDAARMAWRYLFKQDAASTLIQAPTGTGKTIIGAFFIRQYLQHIRQPVLVLAHRREIIDQTAKKLRQSGAACGIIMAGRPYAPMYDVQVGSVDTLDAWVGRGKIDMPPAGLLWIDEAHRAMGKRYQEIIAAYQKEHGAKLLGTTATPIRTDGVGLGQSFDTMHCTPGIQWMIDEGYLVPITYYVGIIPDLKGVKITANEYNQADLEAVMDQRLLIGDVVSNWTRLGRDRPSMFFASGVKHSIHMMEEFRANGIRAVHIDADTPLHERDGLEEKLQSREIEVVCNAQVYVEGTDIPCLSYIGMVKPTKSVGRYLQEAGRGLRPWLEMGKTDCIIADHSGVVHNLGKVELPREWKLYEGKEMEEQHKKERDEAKVMFTCPSCGCQFSGIECPQCNAKVEFHGKAKNFLPADLVNLSQAEFDSLMKPGASTTRIERKQFYSELKGYAEKKGYSLGWAYHKYIDRYKEPPSTDWRHVDGQTPGQVTTKWINGQLANMHIRNAKRAEKANAKQ
jgi:DNA repair protein RadD